MLNFHQPHPHCQQSGMMATIVQQYLEGYSLATCLKITSLCLLFWWLFTILYTSVIPLLSILVHLLLGAICEQIARYYSLMTYNFISYDKLLQRVCERHELLLLALMEPFIIFYRNCLSWRHLQCEEEVCSCRRQWAEPGIYHCSWIGTQVRGHHYICSRVWGCCD